jgi:hypothetical protein
VVGAGISEGGDIVGIRVDGGEASGGVKWESTGGGRNNICAIGGGEGSTVIVTGGGDSMVGCEGKVDGGGGVSKSIGGGDTAIGGGGTAMKLEVGMVTAGIGTVLGLEVEGHKGRVPS